MFPVISFQLIVGESPAGQRQRRLSVVFFLLFVGFLVGHLPGMGWLMAVGGIGWLVILALVLATDRESSFILDGRVDFYEDALWIRGQPLALSELRRVEAHFTFTRGEGAGRNGLGDQGNQLLVYQRQQPQPVRLNVLVISRAQRQVLYNLLLRWRRQGHDVVADVL